MEFHNCNCQQEEHRRSTHQTSAKTRPARLSSRWLKYVAFSPGALILTRGRSLSGWPASTSLLTRITLGPSSPCRLQHQYPCIHGSSHSRYIFSFITLTFNIHAHSALMSLSERVPPDPTQQSLKMWAPARPKPSPSCSSHLKPRS
jgi:hypothetical protein